MKFLEYYKKMTPQGKADFARRTGTSIAYLSQLAHGHRRPGGNLTLAIIRESNGEVDAESKSFGKQSK